MALIEGRDMFQIVRHSTRFSLILPDTCNGADAPLLWLLPIRGGLHSEWVRHTPIERWAEALGLAVIMPEGLKSDYTDMVYGMKWWQFISLELPEYLRRVFGLCPERSRQYVFGAEMGGLGALKLGLRQPERFRAVGAADVPLDQFERCDPLRAREMTDIYGPAPMDAEIRAQNDPVLLARALTTQEPPAFYLERNSETETRLARILAEHHCDVHQLDGTARDWDGRTEALHQFLHACPGLAPASQREEE